MKSALQWHYFPTMLLPGLRHGFSLRCPVPHSELDALLPDALRELELPADRIVQAEQIHGKEIAAVNEKDAGNRISGIDGLITSSLKLPLVIRVADCGPVYLFNPVRRIIGLLHSGRKGTELEITRLAIERLCVEYDSRPEDLIVFLGPCIRPPHYEVDFAAAIGRQAKAGGVRNFYDCGLCTARDPARFYSYRAEQGKTGRMWAVLMLEN